MTQLPQMSIFLTKFWQKVYFDITNRSMSKKFRNSNKLLISRFLPKKNEILGDFGTKFPIGTYMFELMLYRVTNCHLLALQKMEGFIDFPSLDMKDLLWPMISPWIAKSFYNYDLIKSILIKFWDQILFHRKVLILWYILKSFVKI